MQNFFFVNIKRRATRIYFHEIKHIITVNEGHYLQITTDKTTAIVKGTLRGIEHILPDTAFCRINRETIVPIERIESFDRDTVYLGKDTFSISDTYRKTLHGKINLWLDTTTPVQKVLASKELDLS
ncbi:MAG: LytTR family transcriptional regulator [Pedobacter sp.]|nr:MAG: LytTR family transcriptional regulator [Pedobacter sp.]